MDSHSILDEDSRNIVNRLRPELQLIRNKTLFVTGGTGFWGKNLLYALNYINQKHDARMQCTVLTRNPNKFISAFPEFEHFKFVEGSLLNFNIPSDKFDYVLHFASEQLSDGTAVPDPNPSIEGNLRLVDWLNKIKPLNTLVASSGAVYGENGSTTPEEIMSNTGAPPHTPKEAYADLKRNVERIFFEKLRFTTLVRGFAFMGPYFNLNSRFAVADFIKACLASADIELKTGAQTIRSYLYTADLSTWLLKMLLKNQSNTVYNLGSEVEFNLHDIANRFCNVWNGSDFEVFRNRKIKVLQSKIHTTVHSRYVPSCEKAKKNLQLKENYDINECIYRTLKWHVLNSRTHESI